MDNSFYTKTELIDKYKMIVKPTADDVEKIFDIIKDNESLNKYFFHDFNNEKWFNALSEHKIFDKVVEPQTSPDGQYIQFPPWWPGKYLTKIADKIPDKVLGVIKEVKTENPSVIDDCDQAILNMPDSFIADNYKDIIILYDNWLDLKYQSRVKYDVADLLSKFLNAKCYEGAIALFTILSKTKKDKNKLEFKFDVYWYKEIIKKYLPDLIKYDPNTILDVIENKLKEAISVEKENTDTDDGSIGWRSAIEDHSQNWGFDDPKEILTEILRDTLMKMMELHSQEAKKIIERYLEEKYSIFKRLAIHCIRIGNLDDLAKKLLSDSDNLDKIEIHHEFFKLIEDKFSILSKAEKKQFIQNILEVPTETITKQDDSEKAEKYKRYWQANRLFMIKKYLDEDEDLKEFRYIITDYKTDFAKLDYPEFVSYHTSWTGPTSPLNKEQIQNMTPEKFLEWILSNLQPPFDMMESTPEGVSRIFQEVVADKPDDYSKVVSKFLVPNVFPAYICALLRGLANGIKDKKISDLEPLLTVMEHESKFWEDPNFAEIGSREFDIGTYSWVRGVIANVIDELVSNNEIPLDDDFMNRTQKVLVELIENDPHPTEESEKEYGPEAKNMDYISYCINCNRGKAMCAFMSHALRRARMRPEEEKKEEEGKGPFPPGSRMDQYKDFLEKRLDEEKSPSVQSSYGRYLPYLCYLDFDWITKMVNIGKLFPKDKDRFRFWEGHWHGYVELHGVQNPLYDLLREDYRKAVTQLISDESKKDKLERSDNRLAEHLMIAYWRELEDFGVEGNILDMFFNSAPTSARSHAIWFLSTAIDKIKPEKKSKEWQRLKKLWEDRIKNCTDEEIASFVGWLKNCPEKTDDIKELVKPTIKFLRKHFHERDFFEYLDVNTEKSPRACMELLNEMLITDDGFFLHLEMIKNILSKAYKFREDPLVARLINTAVNRLGEMGYYDFKGFLS